MFFFFHYEKLMLAFFLYLWIFLSVVSNTSVSVFRLLSHLNRFFIRFYSSIYVTMNHEKMTILKCHFFYKFDVLLKRSDNSPFSVASIARQSSFLDLYSSWQFSQAEISSIKKNNEISCRKRGTFKTKIYFILKNV